MTYRTFFTVTTDSELQLFKDVFGDNIHQTSHDDELYYINGDDEFSVNRMVHENNLDGYDFGNTIEQGVYSVVIFGFDGEYKVYGTHADINKAQPLFEQCKYVHKDNFDTIWLLDDEWNVIKDVMDPVEYELMMNRQNNPNN